MLGSCDEIARVFGGVRDEPAHHAQVVTAVAPLEYRPAAEILVTGEPGRAGAMLGAQPDLVVTHSERVCAPEPCEPLGCRLEARRLLQERRDHCTQKRWL